ncbi:hypothetical protein EB796_007243 [Bugula neritina]|uniref:Uncharacterized protein n=1 Tax=Bugula neritina TaxID=10212 RepID=A0A7J7K741_BUGNE|nr:hypothetical protein EB796_007243 [Bugula neritina]
MEIKALILIALSAILYAEATSDPVVATLKLDIEKLTPLFISQLLKNSTTVEVEIKVSDFQLKNDDSQVVSTTSPLVDLTTPTPAAAAPAGPPAPPPRPQPPPALSNSLISAPKNITNQSNSFVGNAPIGRRRRSLKSNKKLKNFLAGF